MKAIITTVYGPPEVLELRDIPKPSPQANQVLIRVHATTAFAGDCEIRAFKIPALFWLPLRLGMGIFKPRLKVLGQEFSGEAEGVGSNVTRFKPGDNVFGATSMTQGSYTEYICLPEQYAYTLKPDEISHIGAAPITVGGLNALYFLRKAGIRTGDQVLIIGGCGSIGTWAIQLAKLDGAIVTAIDSTDKLDTMRSIGADHVIDYTKTDYRKTGEQYDVIFDIVGKKWFNGNTGTLASGGRCVVANFSLTVLLKSIWTRLWGNKRVITGVASYRVEDLDHLKELVASGKMQTVIDKTFPLEEMVAAHRYVDSGRKKGHVGIRVVEE